MNAGKKREAVSWAMKKLQVLTGMHDRRGILEWSEQVLKWIQGEEVYLRQEFELRSERFRSLTSLGRKQGSDSELEALHELVEGRDERDLELEFRIMRFSYLVKNGNMTQARDSIGQLRQAVMESGDEEHLLSFYDTASRFYQLDYDPDMALDYIRKALVSDPSAEDVISLRKRMASILDSRGEHDKARQILLDIMESSRAMHAPILELGVLNSIAKSYFDTGCWKEAEEYWDRGIKLARNTGSRRSEAMMLNLVGHMYSRTRSIKDALEMQNKALSVM
jgi:tetratricopeptide (TPR) repeat protein